MRGCRASCRVYRDCGGTDTDIVTVVGEPAGNGGTVLLLAQVREHADLVAVDTALDSMVVRPGRLTRTPDHGGAGQEPCLRVLTTRVVGTGEVVVDAELVERLDAEVRPGQRGQQLADRAVVVAVRPQARRRRRCRRRRTGGPSRSRTARPA